MDFLSKLVDRSLGRMPVLQRRNSFLFEPVPTKRQLGALLGKGVFRLETEEHKKVESDSETHERLESDPLKPPAPKARYPGDAPERSAHLSSLLEHAPSTDGFADFSPLGAFHRDEQEQGEVRSIPETHLNMESVPLVQSMSESASLDNRPRQDPHSFLFRSVSTPKQIERATSPSLCEHRQPGRRGSTSDDTVLMPAKPSMDSSLMETVVDKENETVPRPSIRPVLTRKQNEPPKFDSDENNVLREIATIDKVTPRLAQAAKSLRPAFVPLSLPLSPFNATQELQGPPAIHVTIGRIEVRATQKSVPATKSKSSVPKLSLEEYLNARRGGTR